MTFTQKILKMNDRETKECAQAMWIIKQFLMNVRIFRQKACGVKGFCSGLCNVNHNVHCNEAEIDGCQTNLGCQPFGCDCDNSAYTATAFYRKDVTMDVICGWVFQKGGSCRECYRTNIQLRCWCYSWPIHNSGKASLIHPLLPRYTLSSLYDSGSTYDGGDYFF